MFAFKMLEVKLKIGWILFFNRYPTDLCVAFCSCVLSCLTLETSIWTFLSLGSFWNIFYEFIVTKLNILKSFVINMRLLCNTLMPPLKSSSKIWRKFFGRRVLPAIITLKSIVLIFSLRFMTSLRNYPLHKTM